MKKILFTGFEPFGEDTVNPSWESVKGMSEELEGITIAKLELPVVYDKVAELLREAILKERPDAVICVGQAGGRTQVTPEMVALNLKDCRAADNEGAIFDGDPIREEGPAAYFTTIPVKKMVAAMQEAGIPASLSYCAGTYVCNNVMYHLLDFLAQEYPEVQGGFIHVPYECSQVAGRSSYASLPLNVIIRGLEICAETVGKAMEEGKGDCRKALGNTQ